MDLRALRGRSECALASAVGCTHFSASIALMTSNSRSEATCSSKCFRRMSLRMVREFTDVGEDFMGAVFCLKVVKPSDGGVFFKPSHLAFCKLAG